MTNPPDDPGAKPPLQEAADASRAAEPVAAARIAQMHADLQADHERIRAALGKAFEALATAGSQDAIEQAAAALTTLDQQLRAHFAYEEDGGFFAAVVTGFSSGKQAVAKCLAEHLELQGYLDAAHSEMSRGSKGDIAGLRKTLVELRGTLRIHEHREDDMIARLTESAG